MKRQTKLLLSLTAAVLFGLTAATATQAAGPLVSDHGYRYGYGFGSLDAYSFLYRSRRLPVPPYFALHPPVYYSYPVPRSYGHSPFPYPGTYRTPEIEFAKPEKKTLINPYVKQKEDDEPKVTSTTGVAPQVVTNPFADGNHRAGQLIAAER